MAQARSILVQDKTKEKTSYAHGTASPTAGSIIELRIADLEHWSNWGELEVYIKRMIEALREDINAGGGHVSPRGEASGHFWV